MANEYLKIRDIKFATKYIASWFYSTLEADKVKYLTPQICYDGLVEVPKKVTLFVKIIKPDWKLFDGASSPKGYSYSCDVTVSPGKSNYCVLTGWGNNAGGCYKPGIHRIELWYDGRKIYSQDFTLTKSPSVGNTMKFTDKQFPAIIAVATFITRVDGNLKDSERKFLQAETYRLGVPLHKLGELLRDAIKMHLFDAFDSISKLNYQDKKYVSAFLWSLISISGKIVKEERECLESTVKACGLPTMSKEEALMYINNLMRGFLGMS